MKEGLFNTIVAPATVVIAAMAVVVWLFPRETPPTVDVALQERPGEAVTALPEGTEVDRPVAPVKAEEPPAMPVRPAGGPATPRDDPPRRRPWGDSGEPFRVSLGDGEQAVILGGRASLAVAFTLIGEEEFPSLRVEADGGPKTLALLGPGGRLEFTAGGLRYVASVLRKDLVAKRLDLQVDPQH